MNKQRVIVYVDGFNFYNGLKSKKWKKFYWLNIVPFFESFMKPHQELVAVYYFSAIPLGNNGKSDRQDLFFSANKLNNRFRLTLGKYVKKDIPVGNGQFVHTYEEKETDVRVAVQMIADVIDDACDISILVSADSDLVPPIEFIKSHKPNHKIFIYFPPNRFSYNMNTLCQCVKLEKFRQRFEANMLPEEVTLSNGYIAKRPRKWN